MTTTRTTRNNNTLRIIETGRSSYTVQLWANLAGRSVLGVAHRVDGDREMMRLVKTMLKSC